MLQLFRLHRPQLVVHAAAQPSHDLETSSRSSSSRPAGTYADPAQGEGIDDTMRIDSSMHSLFGASKVAADVLVQEYGRYFGMPTVCFRGSCLTGPHHAGAELHGFLAYLARAPCARACATGSLATKGKQVRDNIHSYDVCTAIVAFAERPRSAEVYNLGGRGNRCSILEAITTLEELPGRRLETEYVEEARRSDHICYISDLRRFRSDYPDWELTISLDEIYEQLARIASAGSS